MELLIFVLIGGLAFFVTRGGRKPIYPGRGLTDLVKEGLGALAKGVLEGVAENVAVLNGTPTKRTVDQQLAATQARVAQKRSALSGDNCW